MIQRMFLLFSGLVLGLMPQLALANEPGGGYEGIASIYFTFIGLILIYGVHDIFGKTVGRISIIPIAGILYYLLPG